MRFFVSSVFRQTNSHCMTKNDFAFLLVELFLVPIDSLVFRLIITGEPMGIHLYALKISRKEDYPVMNWG
jgi:hypothetical protein